MGYEGAVGQDMHVGISSLIYKHDTYSKDHQSRTYLLKPFFAPTIHCIQNNSISVKALIPIPGYLSGNNYLY